MKEYRVTIAGAEEWLLDNLNQIEAIDAANDKHLLNAEIAEMFGMPFDNKAGEIDKSRSSFVSYATRIMKEAGLLKSRLPANYKMKPKRKQKYAEAGQRLRAAYDIWKAQTQQPSSRLMIEKKLQIAKLELELMQMKS